MNIEVDTDELKYYEQKFSKSSVSLEEEINYWEEQIERLKLVWSGSEASVFYNKIDEYLLKLKLVYETTNTFSQTIRKSYNLYEKSDKEFYDELHQENSQYDNKGFLNDNTMENIPKKGNSKMSSYDPLGEELDYEGVKK